MNHSILVTITAPLLKSSIEVWLPYETQINEYLSIIITMCNQTSKHGYLSNKQHFLYAINKHFVLLNTSSLKDNQIYFGDELHLL